MPKDNIKNIVLIGMMGSGKTTVAQMLHQTLRCPWIDIDEYIEQKYQMSIPDMFAVSEDYFRQKESLCCQEIAHRQGTIISCGGGVIKNFDNIEALHQNGWIIYLDRPVDLIIQDIDISYRPVLKKGSEYLYELYRQRHHLYLKACDYHIINDASLEVLCQRLIQWIKAHDEHFHDF